MKIKKFQEKYMAGEEVDFYNHLEVSNFTKENCWYSQSQKLVDLLLNEEVKIATLKEKTYFTLWDYEIESFGYTYAEYELFMDGVNGGIKELRVFWFDILDCELTPSEISKEIWLMFDAIEDDYSSFIDEEVIKEATTKKDRSFALVLGVYNNDPVYGEILIEILLSKTRTANFVFELDSEHSELAGDLKKILKKRKNKQLGEALISKYKKEYNKFNKRKKLGE